MKFLNSDTKMAEAYIALNFPKLEIGKHYEVSEFLKIVKSYFKSITATQLSRALSNLTATFQFENVVGKANIKKSSKGKTRFRFEGRPSAYLLPSKVASIKRVYENKCLVDKIVNLLKGSGVLRMYLKHRVLPALQIMQKDTEGRFGELISALFPNLPLNERDNMRSDLIAFNETQLEQCAEYLIEILENKITEVPGAGQAILVVGFSKLVG